VTALGKRAARAAEPRGRGPRVHLGGHLERAVAADPLTSRAAEPVERLTLEPRGCPEDRRLGRTAETEEDT
jgi:hypothetical protein